MKRYFNTEGICRPNIHYMVRLDERLQQMKRYYVDRGKYFVINRGRQYGKTTTLIALADYLKEDYTVLFMDFQKMGIAAFENEHNFAVSFTEYFLKEIKEFWDKAGRSILTELSDASKEEQFNLNAMFLWLGKVSEQCDRRPIVLMIDEVDSASDYQVFLQFLSMLRGYYLEQERGTIFWSVILAGLYDIKNLKLKIRPDEEHQYNSPWNVAARFNIDMSFSTDQIVVMLKEYEADHLTGMDIPAVSKCIYEYTSGYPYLVSEICKLLDEEIYGSDGFCELSVVWTEHGIGEAVKIILKENTPLFDSMVKQLDLYSDLRHMIYEILYQGRQIPFSPLVKSVNLGVMFGFLKEENGHIAIANRIFEMGLLNMFMTEEAMNLL